MDLGWLSGVSPSGVHFSGIDQLPLVIMGKDGLLSPPVSARTLVELGMAEHLESLEGVSR